MKTNSELKLAGSTLVAVGLAFCSSSCTVKTAAVHDSLHVMEVSVPQQKLALYKSGKLVRKFPVSTSKFGEGSEPGSYRTPLGKMEVAEKIGSGKPAGAVFKSRKWTGEIVKPNSRGRDPIVSRVLWLRGLERKNKNTYKRCIYIHGTAAERDIGQRASYGCIRMKSKDIIDLYRNVGEGAKVFIVKKNLWIDRAGRAGATEQIRALPVEYPDELAPIIAPELGSTRDLAWNGLNKPMTTEDLLVEDGYDLAYLNLPEIFQIPLD